jgi:cobalt-precorrin-7 (C5)-methyltransferase
MYNRYDIIVCYDGRLRDSIQSEERRLNKNAIVLSTGDPMLAGMGPHEEEVIPGISLMQVAFARLGVDLSKGSVMVAYSTSHDEEIKRTAQELMRQKIVFLLAEPSFPYLKLIDSPNGRRINYRVAVCEELGYKKRIEVGTPNQPPEVWSRPYSVVLGER